MDRRSGSGLWSAITLSSAIAACILVGVGSAAAQDPTQAGAAAAPDHAAASNKTRDLYVRHCAKCHGLDGTPKPIAKGAPLFGDPAWAPPLERLQTVITNGKGEIMPKFKGRLSSAEVRDLADYLMTFKSK
jgi:mono/diheme cytochrome c family protein